ncbi:hypothetical protein LOAG_16008 [Loa loa]|uniref:Uncharacterized protein n=1 Tax=Loa loa TaxID=7209 RepID=A0A1S0TEI3_LOALO|nr:hypothetical protein LOAG_16008 [Loa loa]EFO12525.1 hypothetical protein LOAG_16008 [Loa loa]
MESIGKESFGFSFFLNNDVSINLSLTKQSPSLSSSLPIAPLPSAPYDIDVNDNAGFNKNIG